MSPGDDERRPGQGGVTVEQGHDQDTTSVGHMAGDSLPMFDEAGEVIDHRRGPGRHPRVAGDRHDAVAHADPEHIAALQHALRRLAATGVPFEAAQAFDAVPEAKASAKAHGGITSGVAAEGVIRCVGSRASASPSRRGSLTRLWAGVR